MVLNHTGSATLAQVVEVHVGDGADVSVVSLQDWADDTVHLTQHEASVGRDATYKHVAISFGGGVVRMDSNVSYRGPGGSAELLGLYFADAGQHLEHRLFADHNAPRTRSNVVYKGALQGEGAHTVWVGNVLIRKVAEGIETYEQNRNLVLTDGCRADSVPNLEIETGEIEGAGPRVDHGPLRRPAPVLPAVARHPRGRGAAAGRARLLQRHHPQDRRPRARGAADGDRRGGAGEERERGRMSFVRACAVDRARGRQAASR